MDDDFLKKLGLEKGTRKLINHEERGRVLQAMDGCSYKAAAGGSLSNTLVALARLGCRSISDRPLNVAMAGSIAGDPLGSFYRYTTFSSTKYTHLLLLLLFIVGSEGYIMLELDYQSFNGSDDQFHILVTGISGWLIYVNH